MLVLTGLADEHRGTEAVAAGAQDYLVKGGIDGQLLTRAIRYAVERKRADESLRRLYASEMRAAENARLERGLLPQPLLRRLRPQDVVSLYSPGRHQSLLGGDFYDVIDCADGSVFVLIGDVAGHGPDEAAVGVCLRIAWRTLVLSGADPDSILPAMHDVLVSERESDEVFATVAMARVQPDDGVLTLWLAGHPAPAVVDGATVRLPAELCSDVALGIVDDVAWESCQLPVQRGHPAGAVHRRADRGLRRAGRRGGGSATPACTGCSPTSSAAAWRARTWSRASSPRSGSATAAS